jgi:LppP/LprE lipoprotein
MGVMRSSPRSLIALMLPALLAAALLVGCGSSTKTVTESSVPPVTGSTEATQTPPSSTSSTATSTPPVQTTTNGGTSAPTTTHSAPEPAFTQQESKAEGAGAAAAIVRSHGYTPNNSSDYHSGQALRVITATRTGSADGYEQQAFFFVNGHYIGTDSKEPSAGVKVVSEGDTEATLSYSLYRPGDPLSSPTGGQARVTFQLNNGKLVPLERIPPAQSSTSLSRQ